AAESFRDWGRDCWCPSGKDNTCKKRFSWTLGTLPNGYDHKYIYSHFGYNLKATEMQASIGLVQLDKLDFFTKRRQENFNYLRNALSPLEKYFILPNPTKHSEPSWFGFPITLRKDCSFSRTDLTRFLEDKNIQTRMLFAGNLLRHPMFDELRTTENGFRIVGSLDNSDFIAESTFWIGVYPGMTNSMLQYMVEQIFNFTKGDK
nr:DegT/DnrJ/EryC1/StrS family aminotransferase [Pseudobdellovibrionaceae bacterium]